MIAVDTNVIVRFLVCDDEKQAMAVREMLKKAEKKRDCMFISLLVLLETIWVLESAYNKTKFEIITAINNIRQMPVFEFETDEVVERLISEGEQYKADLADILIANSSEASGCENGITFDKAATKLPFFEMLEY